MGLKMAAACPTAACVLYILFEVLLSAQQSGAPRTYVLGPDDQIVVHASEAEELSDKPVRIDAGGYLRLPMAGRLKAGGLTIEQLEADLNTRLKVYLKSPEVSVSVVEFRSQPVSVIGSVRNAGIQQVQGRKTLIEMLSLAGGLTDDAGHTVKITRRLESGRVPLPGAHDDPSGGFSVAEVSLESIMAARNPAENIEILPHDVISVPRAEMVYVVGQVVHAGGFILKERETLSTLQALALAGGLDHAASPQHSRILRKKPGAPGHTEIPVDVKGILAGRTADMPLEPEDILFIPASAPKKAMGRMAEAAIQITTGLVIFRR
jgi:polysaccharide export outer membrane protein